MYVWDLLLGTLTLFLKIRCSFFLNTEENSEQGGESVIVQKDLNSTVAVNINSNIPKV